MKKIFSLIFSLQLTLSPVAFAAEDLYQTTGSGSDQGLSQYTKSIMMTGSGIVGSNFIFCKGFTGNTIPTFSHYIFTGGALTLLTGEIIAATKQAKANKENEKQFERMEILSQQPVEGLTQEQKDAQLTALEAAKKEEIKNRDALEARMRWMQVAEIIYWLSVAGAATETSLYFLSKTPAGAAIGYHDWGLSCGGLSKYQMLTKKTVSLAYGLAPDLIALDFKGAMAKGISAKSFLGGLNWATGHVGDKMAYLINTAPSRIIIFGTFAALATSVRDGFKDRRDKANKNIQLFDASIAAWKKAAGVTTEIKLGDSDKNASGDEKNPANKKYDLKTLTVDKMEKCFSSGADGIEHSAKACRTPIKFNRAVIKFDTQYLNGLSHKAFDFVEALAKDDVASANIMAGDLGSHAARVKSEALNLVKKVAEEQKKKGEKPLEFEKEVQGQMASFAEKAKESGLETGATGKLASLDKETLPRELAPEKALSPAAVEVPTGLDMTSAGSEEVAPPEDLGTVKSAPKQSLADFESSAQDISKESEVSLFKQVSNRYILNYNKMFEKKKTLEESGSPEN